VLKAVGAGVVTVYATSGESEVGCKVMVGTNILGTLFKEITIFDDRTIYINVKNYDDYENIIYDNNNTDVISCKWGEWIDSRCPLTIKAVGVGTTTLIISTDDEKEKLYIKVNVIKEPTKKELAAKDLYAQCGASTVEITAMNGSEFSQGSGFFVSDDIVVTNYHVIAGASKIVVKTKDERAYEVKTILGYDVTLDLALLQVEVKGNPFLGIASENASVGETIYALGSPLGLTGTMTSGMISTSNRNIEGVDYIQITAPLSAGNSGGPLLNVYGEVIGVNTMYYVDGQNLNFAINIQELQKVNTNNPVLVEDFYKNYYDNLVAYLESNTILEDTTKSQSAETCQEIPSMTYVTGAVTAVEGGDLYRFTIKEPGWYNGVIKFKVYADYKNTYFDLYDTNLDFIIGCKEDDENLVLSTRHYLNPGDYYVFVCVPKDYIGTDIPYGFVLIYY
jgi:membrane-bound inhibitor of C-type lysozyme